MNEHPTRTCRVSDAFRLIPVASCLQQRPHAVLGLTTELVPWDNGAWCLGEPRGSDSHKEQLVECMHKKRRDRRQGL